VLAALAERHDLPELAPDPRLFRTLVSAIVSQQLSSAGAAAIMRRVEALFPAEAPLDPAGLAARSPDELRGAGLSRAKVAALHDLAAHVLDGRLNLSALEALDDDAVVAQLGAVRGIGRWTAEMFLLFELRRLDVWPVDDYGVRNGWSLIHSLPALIKPRDLLREGERFRPYRSVAAWYCWRAVGVLRKELVLPQAAEA
jgi:DNA-3-methyladenine glycosylase II